MDELGIRELTAEVVRGRLSRRAAREHGVYRAKTSTIPTPVLPEAPRTIAV